MKTVEFYISCTTYPSVTLSQKWSVSLPEEEDEILPLLQFINIFFFEQWNYLWVKV